jgi:hypothetical protein
VTTPTGVPNLPIGALTVATLGQQLQDQTQAAMRARAGDQMPNIFNQSTGGDILQDLSPFGIITSIWAGINSLIATADPSDIQGPEDLPPLMLDFIEGLPVVGQFVKLLEALLGTYDGTDETLLSIQDLLSPILEFFSGLITQFGTLANWLGTLAIPAVLTEFQTFLTGITNRTAWLSTFKTLIDGLLGITNFSTWISTFKTLIDGLLGITSFSTWVAVFKQVIDFFSGITSRTAWLTALKNVIDTFKALFDSLGSKVWTVLNEIVTHFAGLFTSAGDVTAWLVGLPANLLSVIQTITGKTIDSFADGLSKLTQFTQSLPSVGTLISGLMGSKVNPTTGTNTTLPDLIWWASQLLLSTSIVPSWNLFGSLPEELLALINIGSVGNTQPNLVNDAGFSSAAAFQAGLGWSWDGATNSSGSSGGSAKLTCDGGVKYLFSNLIPATAGQQLSVSTNVKWTKGSSASATIICGVRTYNGDSVLATTTVASLAATGTSGGFTPLTGTYTVPASTTHVRLVLGVTVGTAGTVVWFDEASLKKTALLDQGLVKNLGTTLSDLLPVGTFQTLLNTVAAKTGATVAEVTAVINGKLDPTSTLNGNRILQGNISSAFISELLSTWTSTKTAIDGYSPPTVTYQDPATALLGWASNLTGLRSDLSAAVASINTAVSTANSVALRATNLETRTAALEQKVSIPVVPPVTPPTIVSVLDDFERSTLGSNWTVTYSGSNGSTLGIPNSHDAQYSNPAVVSVENQVAAIWSGTGSASNSEYQKIYTTLGSRAGVPAVGTVGFNDLIGRAVSAQRCLVVRFFGNGQIKFLYRMNSWSETTIGTFSIAVPPTTGTGLEFYCGDKTVNDQTKLYAKIGSTIIGPAYVSASVLASMGKGWGFGMGHGLSGLAPQAAGIINYWGGQDQV